ncbi:MAG TPA: hypothetical protein DIS90_10330 [Cytophagales bacterium]|nr:hypothetical protein [Cytophagales bacterium]HCR55148.1 hypothetical protein [Cytophagales bacterium]
MKEQDEKIIVYQTYDNSIQASLVKTKLDAYGIPCFLSEENFGSIFPFKNQSFGGVRLHIFETDKLRVEEILISSD